MAGMARAGSISLTSALAIYIHLGYSHPGSSAMPPDDLATQAAALLPLPAATFHILVSLAEGDRHGYAIIQDVEERTAGEVRLSVATLYRTIHKMLEQGL